MKQRITLKIAGKETQHLIDAEREEVIRAAADRINREIDSLRFDFRDQNLSDVLSMILLSEETKLLELESRSNQETDSMLRRLEELDASLGQYLSR
ncbi:MAG: cell division protein ZapA [Bacteroidales bacterium]|nr:cell division protein ZapA [Bacteroidales bacterium]